MADTETTEAPKKRRKRNMTPKAITLYAFVSVDGNGVVSVDSATKDPREMAANFKNAQASGLQMVIVETSVPAAS